MNIKMLKAALFGLLISVSSFANATIMNAFDDFSTTSNPSGNWSYGYTSSVGGAFTLLTSSLNLGGGLEGWGWDGGADPFIISNTSGSSATSGGTVYAANALAVHPSFQGEQAVVRFTATISSLISLDAFFFDVSDTSGGGAFPATVDLHVLHNNSALFTSFLNNAQMSSDYSTSSLFLTIGDTIDFVVGDGGNGYGFDHTQLNAVINVPAVPEPSTLAIFALGIMCLASRRFKKQS